MAAIEDNAQNINKVSSQAELLAFNAAIEAARAGEAGRGFAVVAEDVKRLANLSADSARGINGIVDKGRAAVVNISREMDEKCGGVTSVTESAVESFNLIDEKVNQIVELYNYTQRVGGLKVLRGEGNVSRLLAQC